MAFKEKTDFCDLVAATTPSTQGATSPLMIRDANLNGSCEKYQPTGQHGEFIATEVFGEDTAPSNSYGIKKDFTLTAGTLQLNKVKSITDSSVSPSVTKKFALETITITTSGGAAPTIAATCQEVEADCVDTDNAHFTVPAMAVSTKWSAQDVLSAFTLSGVGCNLTACTAVIGCTVGKDKVAGTKIASDCTAGIATVSGTILRSNKVANNAAPTITAKEGWTVTKEPKPTEQNPEAAYQTYTFELQMELAKVQPTSTED